MNYDADFLFMLKFYNMACVIVQFANLVLGGKGTVFLQIHIRSIMYDIVLKLIVHK